MPLKTKIYLFAVGSLILLLILTNSVVYWLFERIMTNAELTQLQSQSSQIVETVQKQDEVEPLLRAYLPSNGMIRIINSKNRALLTVSKEQSFTKLPIRYTQNQTDIIRDQNGERWMTVQNPLIWKDGSIVSFEMTVRLVAIEETLQTLRLVLIGASLVILIPILFISRMFGNLVLAPIHSLISTMEEIQKKGQLKTLTLHETSKDELYKMGKTFNNMVELLKLNFEKQQQFVSDASHELKTPLTVIESYANLLQRWGSKKPEVLQESIDAIHAETVRMQELTQQMLVLAHNHDHWNQQNERFDFAAMVEETSQRLQQAYDRTITVQSDESPLWVNADKQKLQQVLVVLLDNGLKYSELDLQVKLSKREQHLTFSVQDQGIGIPESDQEAIFDRFFRVDKARSRKTGGTGLGLAIAKQIVTAYQGEIMVDSKEGEGTTITVRLPVGIT